MYRARWGGASLLAARSAAPFGRIWWYKSRVSCPDEYPTHVARNTSSTKRLEVAELAPASCEHDGRGKQGSTKQREGAQCARLDLARTCCLLQGFPFEFSVGFKVSRCVARRGCRFAGEAAAAAAVIVGLVAPSPTTTLLCFARVPRTAARDPCGRAGRCLSLGAPSARSTSARPAFG
eukprot:7018248-Prymnesium_polylepis.1